MKRLILISIVFLIAACQNTEAYQSAGSSQPSEAVKNVWVTSRSAELKAESRSSSDTVAALPLGSQLDVIAYDMDKTS